MNPLAGRLALVTGTSRGIGRATADLMAAGGATVIGVSRSLSDDATDRLVTRRCDLTDGDATEQMLSGVVDQFGVPDIVVNNAGSFELGSLGEISLDVFRSQIETNLIAPFGVLRVVVPMMLERDAGHIVTVGSIADHVALPGNAAYGASKFGIRGLHGVVREELRGSKVRATLVSPGATDTSLWDSLDPDNRDDLPDRSGMLRPADVADAIVYAVTRPAGVFIDMIRVSPG